MKTGIRLLFFLFTALISAVFLLPESVQAVEYRKPEISIYDSANFNKIKNILAYDENFKGGVSVQAADLGGDGVNEIIAAPGPGGGPHIKIFRADGSLINSFFAYSEGYRKGVNLAVGDLDDDGKDEIITGTRFGATPHVRVFDGSGKPKITIGFFAFGQEMRSGVNIAACDVDGNGRAEIIAASGPGMDPEVKIFNDKGADTGIRFNPFGNENKGGINVACANVDGGKESELIFGIQSAGEPLVKVYKGNNIQTILGEFTVYNKNFKGGVNVAGGDVDKDGVDEVIVGANTGGGPHIRVFEAYGKFTGKTFFAFESDFKGGTLVSAQDFNNDGRDEIIASPNRRSTEGRTDLDKYIEIDISDQELKYYDHGYLMGAFIVSTGKWSMPTPIGTFEIQNKMPRAYSKKYNLYMPYWMQFHAGGYGLHELPEWSNGYKEGANHLGIRVSHGCVRLGIGPAKELYNWAEVGTTVIVKD